MGSSWTFHVWTFLFTACTAWKVSVHVYTRIDVCIIGKCAKIDIMSMLRIFTSVDTYQIIFIQFLVVIMKWEARQPRTRYDTRTNVSFTSMIVDDKLLRHMQRFWLRTFALRRPACSIWYNSSLGKILWLQNTDSNGHVWTKALTGKDNTINSEDNAIVQAMTIA